MAQIRYQTAKAGEYLLNDLQKSGNLHKVLHDGMDIILFEDAQKQRISVHFIDSSIETYEIYNTLTENAANDTATLFMLWASMMLPQHGQQYHPERWMRALMRLNGNCIYGYDVIDGQVYLFPVYFRGDGPIHDVQYGTVLRINQIERVFVEAVIKDEWGRWYVVTFERTHTSSQGSVVLNSNLREAYDLLGVQFGDDEDTIKRAYRLLARRYHPDANTSPDANEKMQQINNAYKQINDAIQD